MAAFRNRQNKDSTGKIYVYHVVNFCEENDTTPFGLVNFEMLEKLRQKAANEMTREAEQDFKLFRSRVQKKIENMCEENVEKRKMRNGEYIAGKTLAPKSLNLRISPIKSWMLYKHVLNNVRQFRQIKFDKISRSTRDKALLLQDQFKGMCNHADIREKCVVGLYGIHGVRPSLIPQLKIEDIKSPNDAFTPLFNKGTPKRVQLEEYTWIKVKKRIFWKQRTHRISDHSNW